MNHGSLFSGIGGFDLAAEWMGWQNKFHCEWNEFGQKVLHYYWPEAEQFTDITKTDFTKYANSISILTGGFPCQPYSLAGKRKGKEDERHLWPHMLRAIREIQPRWVVGENVLGLINWNGGLVFDEVQVDLETAFKNSETYKSLKREGYECFPYVLPACAVNAPHRRDRVWFVARRKDDPNANSDGQHGGNSEHEINASEGREYAQRNVEQMGNNAANTACIRGGENEWERIGESNVPYKINAQGNWQNFPTQSPICSGDDGLSERLDGITFSKWRNESIKAYGNAVVPQVVYQIFKAIEAYESANS